MEEERAVRIGEVRWWLAPGVRAEDAVARIEAAMAARAGGEAPNLRSGEEKQLYALRLEGGPEPDHLLKAYAYRFLPGLLRTLRPSKSRRELQRAAAAAARGLPVPVPMAAGERRRLGRLEACYLLIPMLRDVIDLRRLWFEEQPAPARRRELTRALGGLARQAHAAGLFQDDFAPNNFLLRRGPEAGLLLVDFERARLVPRLSPRMRRWMLAKLSRHMDDATAAERMRFLLAYAAGDRREARRWWRETAAFVPRLARRDHQRMRRNSTREGRNFRILRSAEGGGFARRRAPQADLPGPPSTGWARATRVRAAGAFWCVEYGPLDDGRGAEIWARANTLWASGRLIPEPLAWLRAGRGAVLVLARGDEKLLGELEDVEAARGEVRVLVNRLGALGTIAAGIGPDAVAIGSVGRWARRAVLLRPDLVRFEGRRTDPAALAPAADRLLSDARASSSASA